MAGGVNVRVTGIDTLRRKLGDRADAPINRFLDRGAFFIQSAARVEAPVDTGRLRNSIAVDAPDNRSRLIGTNVTYAPFQEFGTRPHFVPRQHIGTWARRHGFGDTGIMVSGKAQPFMKPAADQAESAIRSMVPLLAAEIEALYGGGL